MSIILDALKKSETERQQQSAAEFAGVPSGPRAASVPRWLWIVGLLPAVILAVLVGLLLRGESEPVEIPPASAVSTTKPASVENVVPPSFAEQVTAARQNPPHQQDDVSLAASSEAPSEAPSVTVRPALISQNPSAIPASELYPSIHEVRASGSFNLPELHLDIHVYSPEAEDRFVFINMTKLREGAQLAEGPVVVEITPDGVVLGHQGQLFLLPRD